MEARPLPITLSLRISSSRSCSALAAFYASPKQLPNVGKLKGSYHLRGSLLPAARTDYWSKSPRKTMQYVMPVFMRVERDSQDGSSGEDPPETLFMRELRRRGMSSSTKSEDRDSASSIEMATLEGTNESGEKILNAELKTLKSAPLWERDINNQQERSMALNSEGLDGLIPRAQELLKLGGFFFLAFWPLILAIVTTFIALYIYFGTTFIHFGRNPQVSLPPYVDPQKLLEEEVFKQEFGTSSVPFVQ